MATDGPKAYKDMARFFTKSPLLDIGCSFGFIDNLPDSLEYVGIDPFCYVGDDHVVRYGITVEQTYELWKEKEKARPGTNFYRERFETFLPGKHFGMIVCFEVLEHYIDCQEKVEWLKQFCDRLLISVPLHEGPSGAKANGHMFDDLSEKDFPGMVQVATGYGRIFLMWDREDK